MNKGWGCELGEDCWNEDLVVVTVLSPNPSPYNIKNWKCSSTFLKLSLISPIVIKEAYCKTPQVSKSTIVDAHAEKQLMQIKGISLKEEKSQMVHHRHNQTNSEKQMNQYLHESIFYLRKIILSNTSNY